LAHLGSHPSVGRAYAVAVDGGRAYVGTTKELAIVDVADPAAPRELGYLRLAAPALSVAVRGDRALAVTGYADDTWRTQPRPGPAELLAIDVADPARPRVVAVLQLPAVTADRVQWVGDLLYIHTNSGLLAVDVADPANPAWVGRPPVYGPFAVAPDGRRIYAGGDGLSVVGVSR